MNKKLISIVLPAFNEEGNIQIVYSRLTTVMKEYENYEIIFVDDGSKDFTLERIKEIAGNDNKIKYISFSRNFGHQNALKAGLDYSSGECVISMDCDLQHPPELILEMINKWHEGYDIINTVRSESKDISFFKRKTSNLFYSFINKLSDINITAGSSDFRLLDRKVVAILKKCTEFPFFRGMVSWVGFKSYPIPYNPDKRYSGESKYSIKKMIFFALNGITSFTVKPLHLSSLLGVVISAFSFLYIIYAIFCKIFTDQTIAGWTSVLVSVLFLGGIQLIIIGILGEYIGKLFITSKNRPLYIIQEKSEELDA